MTTKRFSFSVCMKNQSHTKYKDFQHRNHTFFWATPVSTEILNLGQIILTGSESHWLTISNPTFIWGWDWFLRISFYWIWFWNWGPWIYPGGILVYWWVSGGNNWCCGYGVFTRLELWLIYWLVIFKSYEFPLIIEFFLI